MKTNSYIAILVIILVAGFVGWFVFNNRTKFVEPTPTFSQQNPDLIFKSIATSLPSANWSKPTTATVQTTYGTLTGIEETGKITSDQAMVQPFEDKKQLESMGYKEDLNLAAGGPGSSTWGYKKTENGKTQIVTYSYNTAPTSSNPNEPLQFNCPCQVTLTVFISNPFDAKK